MNNARSVTQLFLCCAAAVTLPACAALSQGPSGNAAVPPPTKSVDLNRYAGRWYEIARYENGFERGCEGVNAEYRLRPDGGIGVVNTCREGAPNGPARSARGQAKVVEGSGNARLKVSFFGPFYFDYWVLDRADDYSWAIVGEPEGRLLWFLSRTAAPSPELRSDLERRARDLGYDLSLLRTTRH